MVERTHPRVYLDYAASSPLRDCARQAWTTAHEAIGNPSSLHQHGYDAAQILADSRTAMSGFLGGDESGVVLTSGGTESLTLAMFGTTLPNPVGAHVITTTIEHSAVLGTAATLGKLGAQVTVTPARHDGTIDVDAIQGALTPETRLVCIQHANNETGAIQPVHEVAELLRDHPTRLLVDAVQTAGKLPLAEVEADLLAVSAHKFGGPRGIGALRVGPGVELHPLVGGTSHESGRRAGTENVAGAAAMAAAAQECLTQDLTPHGRDRADHLRAVWDAGIANLGPQVQRTVDGQTLPETINVLLPGLRGDTVAAALDMLGFSVGTGSACHAGGARPSHVLLAMGFEPHEAMSALRISFSSALPEDSVARTLAALERVLVNLNQVSGSLAKTT